MYHRYLNPPLSYHKSRFVVFIIEVGKGNHKLSYAKSEYFLFQMPCGYLYYWIKDFLMDENEFDSPIKMIFYNSEDESQVEIKESNLIPLEELCRYHIMDIFVYDENPSDC